MQFAFGSGSMWGVDSGANPTPAKLGILQDASVDFAASLKPLFGTYQFPVAIGRGTTKISWKAKFAQLSGRVMNALFFGATKATGSTLVAEDEAGTIPTTPFQVTVANSATFTGDLGVRFALTGLPLVRVASAPTTGQYSVAAGIYTFAAADTALGVKIDYTYTSASLGENIAIANPVIGPAQTFKSVFTQTYGGLRQTLVLNANCSEKIGNASKLEDFTVPEMDGQAFADSGNNVGTWSLGEKS